MLCSMLVPYVLTGCLYLLVINIVTIVIPAPCPHPHPAPANAVQLNTTVYPGQSLMYECKTGYALVAGDLRMPCSMVEPYVLKGTPPQCVGGYYLIWILWI